jgi:hypothetical protein
VCFFEPVKHKNVDQIFGRFKESIDATVRIVSPAAAAVDWPTNDCFATNVLIEKHVRPIVTPVCGRMHPHGRFYSSFGATFLCNISICVALCLLWSFSCSAGSDIVHDTFVSFPRHNLTVAVCVWWTRGVGTDR